MSAMKNNEDEAGWTRFEIAVDAAVKSGPKPRLDSSDAISSSSKERRPLLSVARSPDAIRIVTEK